MTTTAGVTPSMNEKLAGNIVDLRGNRLSASTTSAARISTVSSVQPKPPLPKHTAMSSPNTSKTRFNRKVAVMGYPCVGKSSITLRFVNGTFPDAYDTTIEDLHSKVYKYKDREYQLRITDTAGQQEYSIFPRSCSVDVDGFILVYAIDDRKSFEIIQTIHDKIVESVGDRSVPMCVVGNKLDLQYSSRVVSTEEGQRLSDSWGAAFCETSAKDNQNSAVQGIFDKILLQIEVAKGNLYPNGKQRSSGKQGSCVLA